MLHLESISKRYRTGIHSVQALTDVSLNVEQGEFVALRGPSGSGKSTLLLIAGTLLAPDEGTVRLKGETPYEMDGNARSRFRAATIGFVFQQFHLVPYLSILENVLVPTVSLPADTATEHARELIGRFGLLDRINHLPSELSTGERQRVALARAVINSPEILLADEPTGNLDAANAEIVLEYLAEFAAGGGSVLLVSHDEHAIGYAQRVLAIQNGRLEVPKAIHE